MNFHNISFLHCKNAFQKNVCVCMSICLSVRRRSKSLNQSTDLVKIRYLGSSCKYLEPFFLVFPVTLKLRVVGLNQLANLVHIRCLANISSSFFRFGSPLKIKGSSHKKKIKNFRFSQKRLQRFSSIFVRLLYIRTSPICHYWLFPEKSS